jgi:hypothetical protein
MTDMLMTGKLSEDIPGNREFEITVGPADADIVGTDGRAIQLAIDALSVRGGGTVRVLAGEYALHDSVRLRSNVNVAGEGPAKTVLRRVPLVWSRLACDADISETQITPEDASSFQPGMGVCIWDKNSGWGFSGLPFVVRDLRDGVLYLNGHMDAERLAESDGLVANYFPMVLGRQADNCVVEGLAVDAHADDPDGILKTMRTAVVYLWRSKHCTIRNVISRNGRGDGICFGKSSLYTTVEDCETCNNTFHGIHPGSHSANCAVRRCHIHHNGSDGLYICWGIRNSVFEDNDIHHNGWELFRSGISIGHKDTDNLMARNHVYENVKHGINFRRKTEPNSPHRNVLRENLIENNGVPPDQISEHGRGLPKQEIKGCGIYVDGMTHDLTLERNTIRETRSGDDRLQRRAVYLAAGVKRVKMTDNAAEGHPEGPIVDESGSDDHEIQAI